MKDPPGASTVWIVDDDLGFLWWLGEIFTEAGYQAVPALSCREAKSLMKILGMRIDLILVNPALAGVSRMLHELNREYPELKIIAIQDHDGPHSPDIDARLSLERPSGRSSLSRVEWVKNVRRLLKTLEVVSR